MVRKYQPNAVIFSDPGLDIRWVGNERGYASETCWTTYIKPGHKWDFRPGLTSPKELNKGIRNGQYWIPAECDFSLRRRFTYHASDNNTVKTPQKLFDIYVNSVGRGACMDLNLPINRDGQQDEADAKALIEFGKYLKKTFEKNLAEGAEVTASNVRGNNENQFGTKNLLDEDRYSYWATDDSVLDPELVVELSDEATFNIIKIRENIKLGQRIDSVEVDAWFDNSWNRIASATSIGACRIIRLKDYARSRKLRLRISSPVCIALSEFSLYAEPEAAEAPTVSRSKEGKVMMSLIGRDATIRYTLDGTDPIISSEVYDGPFQHDSQVEIRAAVFDSKGNRGEIAIKDYDVSKKLWSIVSKSFGDKDNRATHAIDDSAESILSTTINNGSKLIEQGPPQWVVVDMGKAETIAAFTYTPRQDGLSNGVVDKYEYLVSNDGSSWTKVAEGDFPNLRNSPVKRTVPLERPVTCRYFKFTGRHVLDNRNVTIAEIGIRSR